MFWDYRKAAQFFNSFSSNASAFSKQVLSKVVRASRHEPHTYSHNSEKAELLDGNELNNWAAFGGPNILYLTWEDADSLRNLGF